MNEHKAPHATAVFAVDHVGALKRKMLNWVSRFNIFLFLDNQQYHFQPHTYECLLGAGVRNQISNLAQMDAPAAQSAWRFGHLAYDLKAELHQLDAHKADAVGFPHLHFFEPEVVCALQNGHLTIEAPDPYAVWEALQATLPYDEPAPEPVRLTARLTREAYVHAIRQIQEHIRRGDCYELNFCQEFFAAGARLDPVATFIRLGRVSPAPFAALYRMNDLYLISASPERFLAKKGMRLLAQPMKGTTRRNPADATHDDQLKSELYHSTKERSENVMVVDLVRNDLAQVCQDASVQVEELFGIYTFPQVHQMVSTISGTMRQDVPMSALLRANFPMGSMTGAPKLRVMQLIDQYETTARGIFSGAVGYLTPNGDFDFNVVIRSIMYNAATGYLSCQVGSGITFYSDAEQEWEECLLKAAAIRKVLEGA